jgi:hypothetical protein
MATKYETLETEAGYGGDVPPGAPTQWQPHPKLQGAGQYERQGYQFWTAEEQEMWKKGTLTEKWGIGQVTIRSPVSWPLGGLAIVYGFLPFVIPLWWAIWSLVTYFTLGKPRFFPFYGLCVAAGFAIVNEAGTKRICRKLLPASIADRPIESSCRHPGMPSGHVMNAYTLMIWCLLEAMLDCVIHVEWLILILIVMAPVPWARVYNKDHTVLQASISCAVSLVMGGLAYYIRATYYPHHAQPWDWYHSKAMALPPLVK